jgi:GTPase involved in cell partitioning and DNA repair
MPPKKKNQAGEDDGLSKAAKFGRVKNTLTMGFVGLPNVGKSSLTNLLSGAAHAEAANYVRFFHFREEDDNFRMIIETNSRPPCQ